MNDGSRRVVHGPLTVEVLPEVTSQTAAAERSVVPSLPGALFLVPAECSMTKRSFTRSL